MRKGFTVFDLNNKAALILSAAFGAKTLSKPGKKSIEHK
jgi:hypothetical protein